jgi:N-acyl-phosphatidylethanolamine-hydrolysing phospholipase D
MANRRICWQGKVLMAFMYSDCLLIRRRLLTEQELDEKIPITKPNFQLISNPPPNQILSTWIGRRVLIIWFLPDDSGHSTCFVQMEGISYLTDPVWGDRASPISFMGRILQKSTNWWGHLQVQREFDAFHVVSTRFQLPLSSLSAYATSCLSYISYRLQHNHYDHLDYPTVKKLGNKTKWIVPMVCKWQYMFSIELPLFCFLLESIFNHTAHDRT